MSSEASQAQVREVPLVSSYPFRESVQTRWADNDMFGHLNNAHYYALWDTVINNHMERAGGAHPMTDPSFAVVAESSCTYVSELGYPQVLVVGLAIERLGTSSITYRTALWAEGAAETDRVAAFGRWVHVYVDRETRRATPLPESMRAALERI